MRRTAAEADVAVGLTVSAMIIDGILDARYRTIANYDLPYLIIRHMYRNA